MGFAAPPPNRFEGRISNLTGRPANPWGTTVTASGSTNTYGTYTECIPNTAYETHLMEIVVTDLFVSAAARNALLQIGVDHAGGTTYTDVEIQHLLVGQAGSLPNNGARFLFPLFLPASSAVAAKLASSVASATCRVGITLWGKPTRPELVRSGAYVDTFGAVTATSLGTAVTPGTTSDGTYTSIGADLTSGRSWWWWQAGFGLNDASLTQNGIYSLDIALGTSATVDKTIFEDKLFVIPQTTEQIAHVCRLPDYAYVCEFTGDGAVDVYARLQCSGTADTAATVIIHALGG